jgi:hypothetical protein
MSSADTVALFDRKRTRQVRREDRRQRIVPNTKRKRIQLTKKFAEFLDGIDLRRVERGQYLELSEHEACLLVAEGWAQFAERRRADRAVAADKPTRKPRRK